MKKILALSVLGLFCFGSVALGYITGAENRKVVTTAGTELALAATATPFTSCTICAETDNTGLIAVGFSAPHAAAGTSAKGVMLNPGDCYTIKTERKSVGYLNTIWIDSAVNGDGVTYTYYTV